MSEFIPEAGKPCEVLNEKLNNPEWEKCTPLFVGEYSIVYDSETCKERTGGLGLCEFRPLKTERELFIERFVFPGNPSEEVIGAMFDNGARFTEEKQ